MAPPKDISLEFLLWAQVLLVWSIACYGANADPLQGEPARSPRKWKWLLGVRALLAGAVIYLFSHSFLLSGLLLLFILLLPLLRCPLPMRWLAEFELLSIPAVLLSSLGVIRHFHFASRYMLTSLSPSQLAALCIVTSTLLFVVRGGTYMVRGVLRKCGTLPSRTREEIPPDPGLLPQLFPQVQSDLDLAAAAESAPSVDIEEYNRGRLIGNLERILLTLVVAAGSFAALAFLVAAKGVVRLDEFESNRNFTEYFLIGSLSSVLVALCAGLVLRFALLRLWPALLGLQM